MKILLVDDEFLARNAMLMLLAEDRFAGCQSREAVNGREAIRMVEQDPPDIIFIDVSMPVMGGLELLGWIQANAPQVYCVMLSSYSDFEYVRSAMKHGAKDYLLKHQMTSDSLMEVLENSGLLQKSGGGARDVREGELRALLLDGRRADSLDWLADSLYFWLHLVAASGTQPVHSDSLQKTSTHILAQEDAVVCALHMDSLVFVFPRQARETQVQQKKRVATAQRLLRDAIARYHSLQLAFPEPTRCESAEALRNQYLYHRTAPKEAHEIPMPISESSLARENALMTAVLGNHQEMIAQLIDQWFQEAEAFPGELGKLNNALAVLLGRWFRSLLHIDEMPLPCERADAGLVAYYAQAYQQLAQRYQQISYSGYPELVRKTLVYLNQHSAQELSLSSAAEHLNINYSYLSYLFKKETGIGITQYLNAVRIAGAMRLVLLSSLPISTICERVGFHQYGHFMSVFKGITGMSPKAFRKHPKAFAYMMEFSPLKPMPLEEGH